MSLRLRQLVVVGSIGFAAAIAACSGGNDNGGTPSPSAVLGEYTGVVSGPNETGVLDVTFSAPGTAPSGLRPLDTQDILTAIGTLTLTSGATFHLTGSFDPDTGALSLSGGGYSFNGTLGGNGLEGTYAGPNGSGAFGMTKAGAGGAHAYCGAYGGQDSGVWNLVVGASSGAGSIASNAGGGASPLDCTVSGTSVSCQSASGVVASGTFSGDSASGQWHDAHGHSGTWTGSTGKCPSPSPTPDAGALDATAPHDAGFVDAPAVGEDAAQPVDAGSPEDASSGDDASAALDAAVGSDAGQDSGGTGIQDAAPGSDAAQGIDAAQGTDAAVPVDASNAPDAGAPEDAAAPETGAADAGISDAAVLDAAPHEAGACPYVVNVTSVTAFPGGPAPKAITQLGMGTGNYPITLLTNAAVCPGASTVQVSTKTNVWTDIGTCQGNGTGPDTSCDGVAIPASSLSFPAQVELRIVNPGEAAGTLYSLYVFQGAPSPVITGPANANLVAGGGAQQITLTGTGFGQSTVECDFTDDAGVAVVPAILNETSTAMTIQFPASFTATPKPAFWTKVTTASQPGGVAYWALTIDVQ